MEDKIEVNLNKYCEVASKLIEDAYGYYPVEGNIKKNLERWAVNKKGIYDIFKLSPLWNEEELCLVFKTKTYRKINFQLATALVGCFVENHQICKDTYKLEIAKAIYEIFHGFNAKSFNGIVQKDELDIILERYVKAFPERSKDKEPVLQDFADKYFHSAYRGTSGIAYALILKYHVKENQKWNKIFNKIVMGEGLNIGKFDLYDLKGYEEVQGVRDYAGKDPNNWYIDWYYNYEQFFALYSDVLSPLEIEETVYISINPIDYLTQSHGLNWTSCHSLRNRGCYHAATLTMLTDTSTIIAYTLPKECDSDYALQDKKTRVSMFIGDNKNAIFSNSWYPAKDLGLSKQVRELLEEMLANYNNLPNLWTKVSNDEDIDASSYLGYRDWDNGQAYINVHLKDSDKSYGITIGNSAYSIDDPNEYCDNEDTLEADRKYCSCCDCSDTHLNYLEYYDRYVCDNCLDEYYCWCSDVSQYRNMDDSYYLQDTDTWVADSDNAYYCQEYEEYYSEEGVVYIENYGYVSLDAINNRPERFYKDDEGWHLFTSEGA